MILSEALNPVNSEIRVAESAFVYSDLLDRIRSRGRLLTMGSYLPYSVHPRRAPSHVSRI